MKLIFQIISIVKKQWFRLVASARKGMEQGTEGCENHRSRTGDRLKSRYLRSRVCVRYPRQVLLPSGPRVNCDEWTPPPTPPRPLQQQQLRRTTLPLPPSATMYLQLQHH